MILAKGETFTAAEIEDSDIIQECPHLQGLTFRSEGSDPGYEARTIARADCGQFNIGRSAEGLKSPNIHFGRCDATGEPCSMWAKMVHARVQDALFDVVLQPDPNK
ncbi:hypothetical protein ACFL2V_09385 [Pseudomonadota bacterium]